MNLWNSKTIYRKILLILLALHFIGCFVLPLATMMRFTSSMNSLLDYIGMDKLPENITLFALLRLELAMDRASEGMIFAIIPIVNILVFPIHIFGKKRASYVGTLILWMVVILLEAPLYSAAGSITGYEGNPLGALLMVFSVAITILSIVGIIFEKKAQAGAGPSFHVDPEKMQKLKEHAGNAFQTSKAVVKHGAKVASKELPKVPGAVKDFIETAKNEQSSGSSAASSSVQKPIPQTGIITGMKGMFAGAQIPLNNGDVLIIGRDANNCHIILEGPTISSKHCTIQYDGMTGNYVVVDYSTNGTFVGNGGRLPANKKLALSPGTLISIGDGENTFQLG